MSRSSPRDLALLLVLTLVLPACGSLRDVATVKRKPPAVGMQNTQLDLDYGVEPAAKRPRQPAPPAAPTAPPAPPQLPDDGSYEPPPPVIVYRPPAPQPPPSACPKPGGDAVAVEPVRSDVAAPPVPGAYLYRQQGTYEIVGLATIPVDGTTTRVVRDVTEPSALDGSFSYTVDTMLVNRAQHVTFLVRPGTGIFVTAIETSVGGTTSSFAPLTPVNVFPLPAEELTTFTGAGVDPLTQRGLFVEGEVKEVRRVEGCGEVADGWYAEATWTFVDGAQSRSLTMSYTVAPQHGGLFIAEHEQGTQTFGTFVVDVDVTTSFGRITPKPAASP